MMHAFKKAAARGHEQSAFSFLGAIENERPDVKSKLVALSSHHGLAQVAMTEDEVFKGPAERISIDAFEEEIERQQTLAKAGLPVPSVTFIGKDTVFFGMKRMPGVELASVFDTLTDQEKRNIAKQVATFVVDMALALPQKDGQYARHEDLHMGNILIDPATKKLTAVIDFGQVSYRSKLMLAHGLGGFNQSGDPFFKMVEQEYKQVDGALGNNIGPAVHHAFSVLKSLAKSTFSSPTKERAP
jgi:hypothetical protein